MNRNLFLFLFLSSAVSLFLSTKVEAASNRGLPTHLQPWMEILPTWSLATWPHPSYRLMASRKIKPTIHFSDYNEFGKTAMKKLTLIFFRNGRFLTVGLVVGMRGFWITKWALFHRSTYGFSVILFDLRPSFAIWFLIPAITVWNSHQRHASKNINWKCINHTNASGDEILF